MDTRQRIITTTALFLMLWGSQSLLAQDVKLEYKFKVGDVDRYKETTLNNMTSDMIPGGQKVSSEMYVTQKVDKVNPDGSAELLRTIDSVVTMMNDQPMPSQQVKPLIGIPLRVTIQKNGKVLDVKPVNAATDEALNKMIDAMQKQLMVQPGFPSRALKMKETWKDSSKISQETPMGTMVTDMKTTTTLIGFDKILGYDVAVLKVSVEVAGELGVGMGYINGTGRGNSFFSDVAGKEIRSFVDMEQNMDLSTPQGSTTVNMKISQKKEIIK